jgi:2-keto-4-pentenoate hydratase
MPDCDIQALALRLQSAFEERTTLAQFSETGELASVVDAYATQQAWGRLRRDAGETTVGRKIGLTSPGMQRQMAVGEPDFGDLWGSRLFRSSDIPVDLFIQPRVEGEIAFLMGQPLEGPGVTSEDVVAAADAAAIALEVVDSRIEDWRIGLIDTVADNASFGGFTVGSWSERLLASDLAGVTLDLTRNGTQLMHETGAAVLGSPLNAVAWLANRLSSFGQGIRAGDIVMSGAFGAAVPGVAGATLQGRSLIHI